MTDAPDMLLPSGPDGVRDSEDFFTSNPEAAVRMRRVGSHSPVSLPTLVRR
jgi:hypothetical protein